MNTTEFLAAVARAITVPTYQPRFSEEDLLELAAEEQRTTIVPKLLSLRQNYLLSRQSYAVAAGVTSITFPPRAVARGSKEIRWLATNGYESSLVEYSLRESNRWASSGTPSGYSEFGDVIKILPPPKDAGEVVFYCYLKPSKPVKVTRASKVTSVGIDSITVASMPPNIEIGSQIDVTRGTPGFSPMYIDRTVSNLDGNTVTLAGFNVLSPLAGISVGDWVSLAGETAVIQLPEEMTDVLIYSVAIRVLMAMQLPEHLKLVRNEYNVKLANAELVMAPRIEDSPSVLFNGHALLGGCSRSIPRVTVTDQ